MTPLGGLRRSCGGPRSYQASIAIAGSRRSVSQLFPTGAQVLPDSPRPVRESFGCVRSGGTRHGCYNWCRMAQSPARLSTSQPLGARIAGTAGAPRTAYSVLVAVSVSHLLNDTIQSLLPAIYPILKASFGLSFSQVGVMTLALMLTASVLQPVVGLIADRRPAPLALAAGMSFTLAGLLLLSVAWTYPLLILAAALVGVGSSIFHPESSRVARMASGGQHGLAQSVFQVGGNAGSALGPLLAAFLVAPYGQRSLVWCALVAVAGILLTLRIGRWQRAQHLQASSARGVGGRVDPRSATIAPRRVAAALAILAALIFSKYFYLASLSTYFTFYLITKFHVTVQNAQLHLFLFLAAVAAGTILGGPIGDRIGRKPVIWGSILGVLPFSLMLPHANLFWTARACGGDRADPLVGVLGDRRLRAGTDARARRPDLRSVLWLRVRHGRDWCRGARPTSGSHRHRRRLRSVRVPAGHRPDSPRSCQTSIIASARSKRLAETCSLRASWRVASNRVGRALATCGGRGPSTTNRTSRQTAAGSAARASAQS